MGNVYFRKYCRECRKRTLYKLVPRRGLEKTTWMCAKCLTMVTYNFSEYKKALAEEYQAEIAEHDDYW